MRIRIYTNVSGKSVVFLHWIVGVCPNILLISQFLHKYTFIDFFHINSTHVCHVYLDTNTYLHQLQQILQHIIVGQALQSLDC